MVQPGLGGALDTPRTNFGDATYLSRAPDIGDISQEASFHSPVKDRNLARPLVTRHGSNGHRNRGPLVDRPNLPASIGGAEFTPLLKSATRNGRRGRGKENAMAPSTTPRRALDDDDDDDLTALPRADTSVFYASRNHSQLDNSLPQVDSSSVASTPLARRQDGDRGPLQDGNQLSLREQETVIDRIEKENFGLKLKIHFLEETLHKARPGFNEAAVKENTELKVDKVTLQRELQRFKKHLTSAERDLESYRQQMMELQEKANRKQPDGNQRVELERLRQTLDERQTQINILERQLGQRQHSNDDVDKLRDTIQDLEADLRHQERLLTEQQDELEHLKDQQTAQESQDRLVGLEELTTKQEQLGQAQDTISKLEEQVDGLELDTRDLRQQLKSALAQKDEANCRVRQLEEEMADKSKVTNTLSLDIKDKVARLQDELEHSGKEYAALEKQLAGANQVNKKLQDELDELQQGRMQFHHSRREDKARVEQVERELLALGDDRDALQSRLDTLTGEYASQQKEMMGLEEQIEQLENKLSQERANALEAQRDLVNQYQGEIEQLTNDVSSLEAEVRERDKLYDNDSEAWQCEKKTLESERDRAQQTANGLHKTIDRLRLEEGSLSTRESKLRAALDSEMERHKKDEAMMNRQIDDLQETLAARQAMLTDVRNELSEAREQVARTRVDCQNQVNRIMALEGEVEALQTKPPPAGPQSPCRRGCGKLKEQVSDLQTQLERATRDKQSLQDGQGMLKTELQSVRSRLESTRCERDELQDEMRDLRMRDIKMVQASEERLELGMAKAKADGEIQRLHKDCRVLNEERAVVEKRLQDEVQRAALQEKRLQDDIWQLQAKLRDSSGRDMAHAQHLQHIQELEQQLSDAEDQKLVLQELLDDMAEQLSTMQQAADQRAAKHHSQLQRRQAQVNHLTLQLHQYQQQLDDLQEREASLRVKLQRARDQRALYRCAADKLERLQSLPPSPQAGPPESAAAVDIVVRGAHSAQERHAQELRAMVMQMEWMQARWEREAAKRCDVACAKAFVQLQLDVAHACNKAQLRELNDIRSHLLPSREPVPALPASRPTSAPSIRPLLIAVRFIARSRIAARSWACHEAVRCRLAAAAKDRRRAQHSHRLLHVNPP
ncbi:hypothetical protein CDD82_1169 [Ophiocordyceps australis]|uniref:Centrosomin N-terminal motif 1 domain-containing protein n=1 Tax=Ophiocordyceps australis TaxID=1399860 RepID=A0A2C5Y019_9HYPO|nr:hypothetical protein CDD82_1169 [Ophiocordyceps australis]